MQSEDAKQTGVAKCKGYKEAKKGGKEDEGFSDKMQYRS